MKVVVITFTSIISLLLIGILVPNDKDEVQNQENELTVDRLNDLKNTDEQLSDMHSKIIGKWTHTRKSGTSDSTSNEIWEFTHDSIITTPKYGDLQYRLMLDTNKQLWILIVGRYEADESTVIALTINEKSLTLSDIIYVNDKGIEITDKDSMTLHKLSK